MNCILTTDMNIKYVKFYLTEADNASPILTVKV